MYAVFAVVLFFVFGNDSFYVSFELRNMSDYQTPQKFSFYAVISVNNSVARIDHFFSTINHLFCAVDIGNEVFITQSFPDHQINFSAKKAL